MRVEKDYEELLKLFNENKVRYCIIGAYAVGFYSKPRYTKDIDILVEPTLENAKKIVKALKQFGFGSLGLTESDFTDRDNIIQLGYEPVRVDIIMSIKGCNFSEVWENRKKSTYGKTKVFFIGFKELIKSKKNTGRKLDEFDLELLQKVRKKWR